MPFTCTRCGTCCMYLGDYIVIGRQVGPFEFECESVSTGTPFLARVDEDKRDIFTDRTFSGQHPHACPFLRPSGEKIVCTIHETTPPQCRYYRCIVMRIFDKSGTLVGTVRGTLALHSDDPGLRKVWDGSIEPGIRNETSETEAWIKTMLERNGYRVEY